MTRLRVAITIDAPPRVVWRAVSDIPSHVNWMRDAEAIRFTSARRSGVGTTFDCDTRVGPFHTVDKMEVVEWRPGRVLGVRHRGAVRGEGRFTIRRRRRGRTLFVWTERLTFPLWLGGPVGSFVARPILRAIWRSNLRAFKTLVESG